MTPATDSSARPPSPSQWGLGLNLTVLFLLVALVAIGGKVHKLVRLSDDPRVLELLAVLGPDLAFVLVLGGASALAFLAVRGSWRSLVGGTLYGVLTVLLIVGMVEHGFFAIQGEFLPGEMLVYGFRALPMLRRVIASKMGAPVWALLGGVAGVLLLTAVIARREGRNLRRLLPFGGSRWSPVERWQRLAGGWLAGVVAALLLSRLPVEPEIRHLKRNATVTVLREAFRSDAEREGTGGASGPRLTLASTAATRRRNVVFIILESTRARSVTAYTPDLPTTPFLGKLAAEAVRVEHAYAVVPHTSKALIPIQCGVHPKITTAIQEANPGGIPAACLAELLEDQAYATAFIQPAEEGFERRRGLVANFGFETFMGKESLPADGFEESSYFGYEDDSMLEPALHWIDGQSGPFFLTVLTLTVHHDYRLPRRFPRRSYVREDPLNRYLNALAYTDRFLERLYTGLQERGLLSNTLFVIVGDHGEAFSEHGRTEHDNVLYEEGIEVPLLLLGAGLEALRGRVVGGLRETTDIVPTVLEVLGYETRGGDLQGRSLLSSPGHERLFFSCWYTRQCLGLREGPIKTIYHYERLPPEVFDLTKDPQERENLAGGIVPLESVAATVERLKAWKRENNAHYRTHVEEARGRPGEE